MKKFLLFVTLSLLYGCQPHIEDPYGLIPWLDNVSKYIGKDVYTVGDSILFTYNQNESIDFIVLKVEENIIRSCCSDSHIHLGSKHNDGVIEEVCMYFEMTSPNDSIEIDLARIDGSYTSVKNYLKILINKEFHNLYADWTLFPNTDFSQDTIVLTSQQGHSVTLLRDVGILQIKSADGNLWERVNK